MDLGGQKKTERVRTTRPRDHKRKRSTTTSWRQPRVGKDHNHEQKAPRTRERKSPRKGGGGNQHKKQHEKVFPNEQTSKRANEPLGRAIGVTRVHGNAKPIVTPIWRSSLAMIFASRNSARVKPRPVLTRRLCRFG